MFSLFLLSDKLRKVIATLEMFPTQRTLKSVIMTGDTEVVKESGKWMCKQILLKRVSKTRLIKSVGLLHYSKVSLWIIFKDLFSKTKLNVTAYHFL